jgi:glyoxylase-like metal-dependent hydrolase (beta-lactamase superfamily II)
MDKLVLTDDQVVPLDRIADGVKGLRILFVNVFGVADDGGWVLIDGGLPASSGYIRRWGEREFGSPPRAILLTHGHFDHVSAVADLAEDWNVPVLAHENEIPFVTGQQEYPAPDPGAGDGAMSWMSPLFPRGPFNLETDVTPYSAESFRELLPSWTWIHTPGHTPGHVSFFRERDRLLLAGDAFCTTNQSSFLAVAAQTPELHGPPAYYTPDWDAARESVRKLAALDPITAAPGHGLPMRGDAFAGSLRTHAEHFDRVARPEKARTA